MDLSRARAGGAGGTVLYTWLWQHFHGQYLADGLDGAWK